MAIYIRGKRLKVSQLGDAGAVPDNVQPDELGLTPEVLMLKGVEVASSAWISSR